MIWKPGGKHSMIYLKFKKGWCAGVRNNQQYCSDYKQEEARSEGFLIAPREFAEWLD